MMSKWVQSPSKRRTTPHNTYTRWKKMSKIKKALEELDALMEEVNTLREEDEEQMDMEVKK